MKRSSNKKEILSFFAGGGLSNEFTLPNTGLLNNSLVEKKIKKEESIRFDATDISLANKIPGHEYAGSNTWWPLH